MTKITSYHANEQRNALRERAVEEDAQEWFNLQDELAQRQFFWCELDFDETFPDHSVEDHWDWYQSAKERWPKSNTRMNW